MTILEDIVVYKQQLLEAGYYEKKLKTLIQREYSSRVTLKQQLSQDELSIIAELKAKSPTVTDIPERDMKQQIQLYEQYGAACISILTDEQYFDGSFERLNELSIETKLPILCKDFIIDKRQIDVAKYAGASAILLIVNILTDEQLKQLYDYAEAKQLEVLVEVHDKEELERAHQLGAEIIGVNNRDLKTFITDVMHTCEILQYKKDAYYISESGIKTVEDVERILSSGIDGALIGETLMREPGLLPLFRKRKLS